MKRFLSILFAILFLLSFSACGKAPEEPLPEPSAVSVTDALGNTVTLAPGARVVSCYGSFADCWQLSGGSLVGVTEDAVEEGVVAAESVTVVGSVKNIDLEQILGLNPDYVLLSADLAAHLKLREALVAARVPHGYFRVDTFGDYKAMMEQFCAVNGRPDRYRENVLAVEEKICGILEKIPEPDGKRVLLVRVYSTGMKAKGDDNLAGQILKEFGMIHLTEENPSLLEDLSVEKIVQADPDYIIALAMGEQEAADEFLRQNVENNPAWSGLTAVKEGRYAMLPKDLFHYKPNERWAESYEYLAKIIFPELFG